ncbi:hypothetical protein [Curtobacterium sp. RRHDQ10]|uniref:hypothetical protein n=1 Tax=Curtobacterium phyllosphaerae TaxID=3413379 RepID=UPI003BF2D711
MSDQDLPHELEAVITAVPGVCRLFASAPAIGDAATIARELVTTGVLTGPPRVRVDDGVVSAVISSDHATPAPRVARAVHDAVETFMASRGLPLVRVEVRIARVD